MVLAGLETDAPALGPAHRGLCRADGRAGRRAHAERVAGHSARVSASVPVSARMRGDAKNERPAAEARRHTGTQSGGAGVLLRAARREPGAAVPAGVHRAGVRGAREDVLRDAEDGARAGGVGAEWGRGARVMNRPFVQHDFPQAGEGGDGAELLHAVHELAGLLGGAVPLPSGGCYALV